jgi:glucose-1-phosphate cytidylyltransferase
MKVVILAGGFGTRLSEESRIKPKPMIEIGGRPILWHIMKTYSHYGYNDFIICLGYKGYYIKEYFAHYFLHESNITFNFKEDNLEYIHNHTAEPWTVTLVNTGIDTMTGGRIKKIKEYVKDETFMLTYGDGLSDVNIKELVKYHKSKKRIATITSVQPPGRFGTIALNSDNSISGFQEKPKGDGAWVNGGFMVLKPDIFSYIDSDNTVFEKDPLEKLAVNHELIAFKHNGFWQPMDTLRDKKYLEKLWEKEEAAWKVWDK